MGAIIVVAVVVRLLPITWGLPIGPHSGFFHPDEHSMWRSVLDFPGNYFTNRNFLYGTSFQYTIGLILLPLRWLAAANPYVDDQRTLFTILACRLASVATGTAAVYLGYRLGHRLFDETVGLLTAAFMAVSLYLSLNSAFATLDVTIACLVTLNLLFCLRAVERPTTGRVAAAGLALGYLLATKISTAVFLIIPALLGAATPGLRQARLAVTYLVPAAAVFGITTPQVVLDPHGYVAFMHAQKAEWLDRNRVTFAGMVRLWWAVGSAAIGAPVVALAAVGVGARWRDTPVVVTALVVFGVAQLAFFRGFLQPRFVLPIMPIVCLLAAAGSAWLLRRRLAGTRTAGALAVTLALGHSLARTVGGIYDRFHDPRTRAAQYLDAVAASGATVGLAYPTAEYERNRIRWMLPPVDSTRYRVVSMFESPDFILATADAYEPIARLFRSPKLMQGYVVAPPYRREWFKSVPPEPERLRFFDCLLNHPNGAYKLVVEIRRPLDVPVDMSGYTTRIYQRRNAAGDTSQGCGGAGGLHGRPGGE